MDINSLIGKKVEGVVDRYGGYVGEVIGVRYSTKVYSQFTFKDEYVIVRYIGKAYDADDSPKMAEERLSRFSRWQGTEEEMVYMDGNLVRNGNVLDFIED